MALTTVAVLSASVIAVLTILDFFVKVPGVQTLAPMLRNWAVIISGMSLALGAINVVQVHSKNISRGRQVPYSLTLLGFMAATLVIGFTAGPSSTQYGWLYEGIVVPVGQAIFSLLAFYITTAAYRAFKLSSRDATILLVSGCLVLIGRVPLGELVWSGFPKIADWMLNVPNVAGTRAIILATALGYLALQARIILGLERQSLGQ